MEKTTSLTPQIAARFWEKVEKRDPQDCWIWKAAKGPNGYGRMQFTYRGQFIYAHRLALLIDGRDPFPGAIALHSCDNPSCVNPAHLDWGTQRDNMRQAISRGRAPHRGRVAGEKNGNAKLTHEDVIAIRKSTLMRKELAEYYGVTPSLISAIIVRRAWVHV